MTLFELEMLAEERQRDNFARAHHHRLVQKMQAASGHRGHLAWVLLRVASLSASFWRWVQGHIHPAPELPTVEFACCEA